MTGAIPTTGSHEWYGTTGQPSAQIVFDKDQTTGNNNDNNILVGEQVYSTNPAGQPLTDWWFTGGAAKAATIGITCPSTSGGSGSDCHGTLAHRQPPCPRRRCTPAASRSAAASRATGSSRAVNLGQNSYVFTDTAKVAVIVTAKAAKGTVKTGSNSKVIGTVKPVGPNAKVSQVKKNGKWKIKAEKALAADGSYKLKTKAPGKPARSSYGCRP